MAKTKKVEKVEEVATPKTIEGHVIVHVSELPNGYISIATADGFGYTITKVQYETL